MPAPVFFRFPGLKRFPVVLLVTFSTKYYYRALQGTCDRAVVDPYLFYIFFSKVKFFFGREAYFLRVNLFWNGGVTLP